MVAIPQVPFYHSEQVDMFKLHQNNLQPPSAQQTNAAATYDAKQINNVALASIPATLSPPSEIELTNFNPNNARTMDTNSNAAASNTETKSLPTNAEILDLMLKMPQLKSPIFSPVDETELPQSTNVITTHNDAIDPPSAPQPAEDLILPSVPTTETTKRAHEELEEIDNLREHSYSQRYRSTA